VIEACLAALDGLVDGRLPADAPELELLAALEDELAVRLVGPGVAATPAALRLAASARTALSALQAFFDDAEQLHEQRPTGRPLALVSSEPASGGADWPRRLAASDSVVHIGVPRTAGPYCRDL
jgi:hypothetical protein